LSNFDGVNSADENSWIAGFLEEHLQPRASPRAGKEVHAKASRKR
jgi:hypothetical protein